MGFFGEVAPSSTRSLFHPPAEASSCPCPVQGTPVSLGMMEELQLGRQNVVLMGPRGPHCPVCSAFTWGTCSYTLMCSRTPREGQGLLPRSHADTDGLLMMRVRKPAAHTHTGGMVY